MDNGQKKSSDSATERAEVLVDKTVREARDFAAKAFERTREEAEDIWAEAQHLRKNWGGRKR
jgi:vacuolar-type H+-ATPase subunit H